MLERREFSLRKRVFNKDLEEVRMGAIWIYGGEHSKQKTSQCKSPEVGGPGMFRNSKGVSGAGIE